MVPAFRTRRGLLAFAAAPLATGAFRPVRADTPVRKLTLDHAAYNPLSLVLRHTGLLDAELARDGVQVQWEESISSYQAIERLHAGTLHIGSAAAAACLLARMRGVRIQSAGVFAKPEWTALVAPRGSAIRSVEDLAGRRVAVAQGTDAHIFLLRALAERGVALDRVRLHHVPHEVGLRGLRLGIVDAWAGFDPYMARAEVDHDARLFYRNQAFNSWGSITVREELLQQAPGLVARVLAGYEKARSFALAQPADFHSILARSSGQSERVVAAFLARTRLTESRVVEADLHGLLEAGRVLQQRRLAPAQGRVEDAVAQLVAPLGRPMPKAGP